MTILQQISSSSVRRHSVIWLCKQIGVIECINMSNGINAFPFILFVWQHSSENSTLSFHCSTSSSLSESFFCRIFFECCVMHVLRRSHFACNDPVLLNGALMQVSAKLRSLFANSSGNRILTSVALWTLLFFSPTRFPFFFQSALWTDGRLFGAEVGCFWLSLLLFSSVSNASRASRNFLSTGI